MQSANSIAVMRSSGNALFGTVGEIYDRYLRNIERRFPMMVIIANDGPDMSQRITNERANEVLDGLKKSGVRVNAVLINPTGWTGTPGSREIRTFTLAMVERTAGALEQASGPTVPSRLKILAGRIAQQPEEFSPKKDSTPEFCKQRSHQDAA